MDSIKHITDYFDKHKVWEKELLILRDICTDTELSETIKWGIPTYTINNKNVVSIAAFKDHIALWFFQGSFLSDPDKILINANKEVTRGQLQWRFTAFNQINIELIKKYLLEAIQNEKDGKRIKIVSDKSLIIPVELKDVLSADKILSEAFDQFSKSKKREFAEHIISAKRLATKLNRIDKIIPLILKGEGLHDRYK
ncbi:YdeI/OmpD-associated family protein [Crocinitomix catalasitica]|uniref:YdeI/OmpD-associated family protein n=1 Tax=Crocinitomix catalasitica TaxID=184607 RepID=UPI000482E5BD|nr:DUF1801 domain-containing protein [Crocinitomix catalasitica]